MSRRPPQDLYDETLRLVTAIAQPDKLDEEPDEAEAAAAFLELRALFEQRESDDRPDPFLTETLADFTEDNWESIRLYRLALEQCSLAREELTYTKRLGLAQRLNAVGREAEALEQLALARQDAFKAGEKDYMAEMDELASEMRSNNSFKPTPHSGAT